MMNSREEYEKELDRIRSEYEYGESKITDLEYDVMVNDFEKKFGIKYNKVGAEFVPGTKVLLPFYMGSLDKAVDPGAQDILNRWAKKFPGPYLISDKLDGNAGLFVKRGLERKLYTRGNGTEGTDISQWIPYLNFPTSSEYDYAVVGEIVLPRSAFFEMKNINPSLSNPRNTGSGLLNSKTPDVNNIKKLHYVAYNLRELSLKGQKFSVGNIQTQKGYLQSLGFELPWYGGIVGELKVPLLENYLTQRREQSLYELDGLVITDNSKEFPHLVGENPDHSIAFKVNVFIDTVVTDVEWNASKDGNLIPVVHFEKRNIVTDIQKATGHNAKNILDKGIGPGAIITITRSGDVIPYIYSVKVPSENMKWPNYPSDQMKWNDTNVHLMLVNPENNSEVQKEKILYFLRHMNIENVGPGRVDSIYNAGYTSIKHFLNLTVSQLSQISGLGVKSGQEIVDQIQRAINGVPLYRVMIASGAFGTGFAEERMQLILNAYPNIFNYVGSSKGTIAYMLRGIGGFDMLADTFEERIPEFLRWMQNHPEIRYVMPSNNEVKTQGDLSGQVFLFTGITAKQFSGALEARGAKVKDSYSNDVTIVVAVDPGRLTGKLEKASKAGKKIISLNEFKSTYGFT